MDSTKHSQIITVFTYYTHKLEPVCSMYKGCVWQNLASQSKPCASNSVATETQEKKTNFKIDKP